MLQNSLFNTRESSWKSIWIPIAVMAATIVALCFVQSGRFAVSEKPSRTFLWIVAVGELGFYLAVRLGSGLKLERQVIVITAFILSQAALYAALRLDGFTGDGRLLLDWRWKSTPHEKFLVHQISQSTSRTVGGDKVVLSPITSRDSAGFRGNDRTGELHVDKFTTDWEKIPPKLRWRQPIGGGWSSFAAVGDYAVTQEQRGGDECVVCYCIANGEQAWEHRDRAEFFEITGGGGPRATPTIHDGRVFSLGGTGILNCLDGTTGQKIWSVNILQDNSAAIPLFGVAGSPLVIDDMVIVGPGGTHASLVAYDRVTGKKHWAVGDAAASYSSPQLVTIEDRHEVLNFNAVGLFSHDPSTGKVMWQFPWPCETAEMTNVGQPVLLKFPVDARDAVLISSGYGRGSALLKVNDQDDQQIAEALWIQKTLKSKFSSVVAREGYGYGLDDGILTCIDLADGNRRWKAGRYGYGQVLLVNDLLLIQAESGEVVLVESTPLRHHELARFAALSDRTWNHPTVIRNLLLVRNDREAACYELP